MSHSVVPKERMTMPSANNIVEKNSVFSTPSHLAVLGAKGEISANASNGMVVKKPAVILEIANSLRMKRTIGPTTVRGVRKVIAIKTMPITRSIFLLSHVIFLLGVKLDFEFNIQRSLSGFVIAYHLLNRIEKDNADAMGLGTSC